MTAAAMLMKEIETMPEEAVQETLDFALFLRTKNNYILSDSKKPVWLTGNSKIDNPIHIGENFRKIPRDELYER